MHMGNTMRKLLMAILFTVLASSGTCAQTSGQVLNLLLKDGTAYHFLLADQHPVLTSRNGQLYVTYRYAEDGSLAPQLCFERDAVQRLTFGAQDPVGVVTPTENTSAVRFDLVSPNRIRVCGLSEGDRVEAASMDGRSAVPARRASSGELTLDLCRQPRGVYVISVNHRWTFKFVKP